METSDAAHAAHAHADHCAAPHGAHAVPPDAGQPAVAPFAAARRTAWVWGLAATLGLMLLYAVTLSAVSGAAYAWDTFLSLWYWIVPLAAGFGLQVGLFGYSRSLARAGVTLHRSGVVASGGASAVSMVMCCTHRLADVLPLVGLAGLALFLSSYLTLFMLAGVLSNFVGTVFLLGEMQKHGLFDPNGRVLSPLLRLPVRPALPWLAGGAVLVQAVAIYWEVWA
jgi:hypothetical protein